MEREEGALPPLTLSPVPGMGGVGEALALKPSYPAVQYFFCHLADCGRALS